MTINKFVVWKTDIIRRLIAISRVETVKKFCDEKRYWKLLDRYDAKHIDEIKTDLSRIEKLKVFELSLTKKGTFVEIGSYLGASASIIALAIRKRGDQNRLYCIDSWNNDAMSEGYRDTYDEFLKNTAVYRDIIIPMRGKSDELNGRFSHKIDFLFIDGDHSYEGVKNDIENWFPKLNHNALVVFHDIGWAKGVQRAVKEIVEPRATKKNRLKNLFWAWL